MTRARTKLGVDTLRDDASALYSFVDSVCEQCEERVDSPAYPDATRKFFTYINQLGRATKRYLHVFPEKVPSDPRLYRFHRGSLEAIRNGWFDFHEFIKPAVEADTLHIPYSLLTALTRRFTQIAGFEDTEFAVFHFNDLNYLQLRVSEVKKIAEKLAKNVPNAPLFGTTLGMIGIPYSQASSLFLNCLITHEMGHFAFQKMEKKAALLPAIKDQLSKTFSSVPGFMSQDTTWYEDRLASWSEEIFCDLFATRLIGPCFSLAFMELYGFTVVLNPENPDGYSIPQELCMFKRSHPADIVRLQQQVRYLVKLKWWPHVQQIKSHYIDVLDAVSIFEQDQSKFRASLQFQTTEKSNPSATISAFCGFVDQLIPLVEEVVGDLDTGTNSYELYGKLIEDYLQTAVVPSTVFDGSSHWYPDVVALLNAFAKFRLESLDKLMSGIENQRPDLVGHRSRWMKRLELLTTKAIEDHQLLIGEKGAIKDVGSFKRADLGSAKQKNI